MRDLAALHFSPCKRWDDAQYIYKHHSDPLQFDSWTQQMAQYLYAMDEDPEQAQRDMPTISFAHCLYTNPKSYNHMLEAFILTGASIADVGKEFGIAKNKLEAYVKIFFDVQPWLKKGSWIYASLFEPIIQNARVFETNQVLFWKYLGYHATMKALKEHIQLEFNPNLPMTQRCLKTLQVESLKKAMMSMASAKPNHYVAQEMLPVVLSDMQKEDAVATEQSQVAMAIKDWMDSVQLLTPQDRDADLPAEEYPGQHYDIKYGKDPKVVDVEVN